MEEFKKKMKRLGSKALLSKLHKTESTKEQIEIKRILDSRGVPYDIEADEVEVNTKHPNVGKNCVFIPFRKDIQMDGIIKAHVNDKRVARKYYKILGEDGKIYHKKTDSNQLNL